jgi:hypothetical protein
VSQIHKTGAERQHRLLPASGTLDGLTETKTPEWTDSEHQESTDPPRNRPLHQHRLSEDYLIHA